MPRRISSIGLQNSNQLFGIIEVPKQPNVLKLVIMVQSRVRGYLARIHFRRRMFGVICIFTIKTEKKRIRVTVKKVELK